MFKFEIGKLYRLGNSMGSHAGKVIRITNRKTLCGVNRYTFEMVYGEPTPTNQFDENSIMGQGLIPVRETIVIYRNDNKVVAVNKITGKEGVARCAPDDTFNFETGAKLAFKRLVGEDAAESIKPEEPKFKVGEFVRVVSAEGRVLDKVHGFPIGQIVKVVRVMDGEYECEGVVIWGDSITFDIQAVNPDHIEKLGEA